MKKILFPVSVLCSMLSYAQKPIFTQSNIESARVYTNGVELKHKASAQIPAGTSEVVITNVANYLNENTVQISVPKYVTVMSVQYSNAYVEEYDNNEESPLIKPVKEELTKKQEEYNLVSNQLQSVKKSIELLDKNQSMSNSQNFSVAELSKLLDYYNTKRTELNNKVFSLTKEVESIQAEIDKLKNKLTFNENANGVVSKGKLILNVNSSQAGTIPMNITYISNNAYWSPSYDLRIEKINAPIQTVFKAQVVQNTGVDWKNVKLSLTSATANASTQAPVLTPWFVDYKPDYSAYSYRADSVREEPIIEELVLTKKSRAEVSSTNKVATAAASPLYVIDGTLATEESFSAISPDQIVDVTILKDQNSISAYGSRGANGVVVVTTKAGMGISTLDKNTNVSENQLHTTYNIDIPYTILSNNKKHSVALKEINIPAEYKYISAPKYDNSVYLVSYVKDYAQYHLLSGEANVIFEGTNVGKTTIQPNSAQEGMRLSLGKDENISVSRTKINEKSGTKILSSRKQEDILYQIEVRNNKREPIQLTIEDQIPLSSNNDIEIIVTEKDAGVLNNLGKIEWNLQIKPNESKKVRLGYQIKSAKDKTVITK